MGTETPRCPTAIHAVQCARYPTQRPALISLRPHCTSECCQAVGAFPSAARCIFASLLPHLQIRQRLVTEAGPSDRRIPLLPPGLYDQPSSSLAVCFRASNVPTRSWAQPSSPVRRGSVAVLDLAVHGPYGNQRSRTGAPLKGAMLLDPGTARALAPDLASWCYHTRGKEGTVARVDAW